MPRVDVGADWRGYPRRHPVWAGAGVALLLVVLFLAVFDLGWFKGPIERGVSKATDREFRIDGDLKLRWGFPPTITAKDVHLANAAWSGKREMAHVDRVELQVRLLPLFVGHVVLPKLVAEKPFLLLERNDKGLGNWDFASASKKEKKSDPGALQIDQANITGGRLHFIEPTLQTELALNIDSAKPSGTEVLAPLLLKGSGKYRGGEFEMSGKVDSPLELRGKPQPYRIDLRARSGATEAHVSGGLREPLQIARFNVSFELQGDDLASLYELIGIPLPSTPPYKLRGELGRRGDSISYHGFKGQVGDSDLAGDADIDLQGKRPRLKATLTSHTLDFDDLAGFVGGTPSSGEGETASTQQVEKGAARKASGRVLPSEPYHLEKLRAMDADVTLTAEHINAPKLPLDAMTAHLKLDNGLLTLQPLDFQAAGGKLKTQVTLNAREDLIRTSLDMDVRGLELPKLMPNVKSLQDSYGSISGIVKVAGAGNSPADMLATSDGNLSLIMGPGRMSNLLLELAGLDVAEALKFLIGKDRTVALRCAYADFSVADGMATINAFAFDTSDTALLGKGGFSFKDESLDITLLPRPKDFSPISLRSPLKVRGHFADPSFAPEAGPLLLRGAVVAALASIAPPAALLGLIETGPGKDTDCGAHMTAAK